MSNKVTNQSKYWILKLLQKEFIELGLEPILIDSISSEPILRLDKFSVYVDTRDKYTLYQYGFQILLSRVCKSQIKKTIMEAIVSQQPKPALN